MKTIQLKNPESLLVNAEHSNITIAREQKSSIGENPNTGGKAYGVTSIDRSNINFLIDYIIKTHHNKAKEEIEIIYDLLQKVTFRHNEHHPELKKLSEVAFFFFHDLLNQMSTEEQYLFPRIRQIIKQGQAATPNDNIVLQSLQEKIKLQKHNHQKAFNYLKDFREITSNYQIPIDACNSYKTLFEKMMAFEDDLNLHFQLEDYILFPNSIAARK